jgi:hypothetical protein
MSVQPAEERGQGWLRLLSGTGMEANTVMVGKPRSLCWRFERGIEDDEAGCNQEKTEHENTSRAR